MKLKVVALLTAIVLGSTMLGACGSTQEAATAAKSEAPAEEEEAEEA